MCGRVWLCVIGIGILRVFQEAGEWEGGMVLGMADRAKARKGGGLSSVGSIDYTEESLAHAFNHG